jgi:NTE family protein
MFLLNGKMGISPPTETEDQENGDGFLVAGEQHLDGGAAEIPFDVSSTDPANPDLGVPPIAKKKRGGIALALGGGAAKGWAHIGVLRAFQEANIPIAMIAGTSIGALVGGCYLAGKLDALEEFARSLTFSGMLRYMDFSLRGAGLISGRRLGTRMAHHLGGIQIEDMEGQFVSICTDIRTGHEIWLHDGPLVAAIRASYALPGVFAPVLHNGRHLVDGAIVNPVPVSACRAYEPEAVIAVDLNSEAFGRATVIRSSHYDSREVAEETENPAGSSWRSFFNSNGHRTLNNNDGDASQNGKQFLIRPKSQLGTAGVMMEAFNIIQDRIARARMAGDPPDYTVRPRLQRIGLADFHKADESIAIGYREAKLRIGELKDAGSLLTV